MIKKLALWLLPITVLLCVSTITAHGVLFRENKNAGDYVIVMDASADVPELYEQFGITYAYLLFNKDGSQYVSFDSARVVFGKKKGGLIVNAELDGPKNGLPGTALEVAMPGPGDYDSEITFLENDRSAGKSVEIAKASFDFTVKELPKTASGATLTSPPKLPEPGAASVPPYIWALVLFVTGVTLGRFGTRIYRWAFSE
jgi:hypothetical protein